MFYLYTDYFLTFSGTLVPATFLCILMFLHWFLIFLSLVTTSRHTFFVVAANAGNGEVTATGAGTGVALVSSLTQAVSDINMMVVNNIFIEFPYSGGCCAGGGPPNFGAVPNPGAGVPNAVGTAVNPVAVGAVVGTVVVVAPPLFAPAIFSCVRPNAATPRTAPIAI